MNSERAKGRSIGRTWLALLGGYLLLRLLLATTAGYVPDLMQYKFWSLQSARVGLAHLYEKSDYDYPPLYAYVLRAIGYVHSWFDPHALRAKRDSTSLTILVKTPPLLFDLAIAVLLVAIARSRRRVDDATHGVSADRPADSRDCWPAAAYLLNPAVLFGSGHWGAPDAVHSFLAVAALVVVSGPRPRAWLAWPLIALAVLMKPLGAPYVPLLFVVAILTHGWRSVAIGLVAAAATTLALLSPFFVASGTVATLQRIVADVGTMSFTSVNAHNFWWLVGPWRDADVPWLGPLTVTQVALVLIALLVAVVAIAAVRIHRAQRNGLERSQILALGGVAGFGFFMVAPHLHENHGFAAIPLLLAALASAQRGIAARRQLAWLVLCVSLGVFFNLLPHDLELRQRWPFSIGGTSSYVGDEPGRSFFAGEFAAGYVGSLFDVGVFASLIAFTLRGGISRLASSNTAPA